MTIKLIPVKEKFVAGKVVEVSHDLKRSKFTLSAGERKYKLSTEFYIQEGDKKVAVRLPDTDINHLEKNLLGRTVKYSYIKSVEVNTIDNLEGKELDKNQQLEATVRHHWRYNIKTIDEGPTFQKNYPINPAYFKK